MSKDVLSENAELRILPRTFEEEMEESYGDYAMSVIVARALPDARDGLKPVHRRILYSMNELGLEPSKAYKKSARIVGDCFVKGTLVTTPTGLVPIEQLQKGAKVVTTKGIEEVTELYIMPERDIYSVTLDNGLNNKSTGGQKYRVLTEDLSFIWVEAKDLKVGDYVVCKQQGVEVSKYVKQGGIEVDEDVAYLLGYFLADGWVDRHKRPTKVYKNIGFLCRTPKKKPVIDRVRDIVEAKFNYKATIKTTNGYGFKIYDSKVNKVILDVFSLQDKYAGNITVPESILRSCESVKYSFISGFIDGDGHLHKNRNVVTISSASHEFILQLNVMMYQMGYTGSVYTNKVDKEAHRPLHYIEIRGEAAQRLLSNLHLYNLKHKAVAAKSRVVEASADFIPYAGKHIFDEFSDKHLGGGWYESLDGGKVRAGIKYPNGAKLRYSKDLSETIKIYRSTVESMGIYTKMELVGSKYLGFIRDVLDNSLTFSKVTGVEVLAPEITYDIQVSNVHEFVANGMVSHNCMGKYHPHGDSSIYEAMVRLAQPFSMRYPLVDGHGNFGSIDGDDAAAQRYTEARMLKLTLKMLEDLDKNTVDFVENYDGELEEPTVLPAKLPNLLVNGASGIAVGMATNMPPHNLNEVVDAICKVIDNKVNENRDTNIDEVIEVLSAPDFPTGGVILGTSGIKEAYRTGRGKLVLRAKARIDVDSKGRQSIVVTEIPYQVTKSKLVEKIAELVKDKKIEGISDLRDESDRNGIRIVIEVRRDANANIVLNQLYKFTQMQVSFGIINLALVNGEPKLLNLLDLINVYLEHQKEVVTRRTQFELDKAEKRAHIIEGLFIALDHIDEVINIIRASKDGKEAKGKLIERFGLSDEQANAIVEMRLRGLTGLERDKLQAEYDELVKTIAWLKSILADEKVLYGVIRQELVDIVANFGDKRRTEIANTYEEFEDFDVEDLIPDEQCVVTMTTIGYIKRLPVSTYKSQKRGGRGVVGMQTRDDDTVQHLSVCMTHDNILFFTGNGRVYCKKAYEIPEAGRNAKGTAIVNLLKLDPNEKIKAIIPVRDLSSENKASFIMMTKYGTVKKTPISEFANIRQQGIIAINILDGDELVQVDIVGENETIFVATNKGLGSRFKSSDVRNMGRSATGVRAMQTSKDNYIIGFAVCSGEDDKIIFVSEQGFGKATFASEFPVKNRGLKGMLCYNSNEKTGQLTCVMTYNAGDELLLVNSSGIVIRIKSKDIPILGRHTRGSKLITIDDGEYITSVTKVVDDDED